MAESVPQQGPLSRTLVGGSECLFAYVCQPCTVDNKTFEAVGFCVTCTELLCGECFRCHLRPSPTKNHKLLSLEDAKKDKSFACSRDLCTETCRQHPEEIVKYFCKPHSTLGCSACMIVDHRACEDVQHIPKVAEAEANGPEYSELVQELDAVLLRTKRLIKDSIDNKTKAQRLCDRVLEDIRKAKEDVLKAFEKLESNIKTDSDKIKYKHTQKMDKNIVVFDAIQKRAETLVKKLKSMKASGQYCKLFVALKVEKDDIQTLDAKLDKAASDNTVAGFKFQPCKELQELLEFEGCLGSVYQHGCNTSNNTALRQQGQRDSNTMKAASPKPVLDTLAKDINKSQATKKGEINVKTDDDDEICSIFGLVSLSNGRLVAADNGNEKVKCFFHR